MKKILLSLFILSLPTVSYAMLPIELISEPVTHRAKSFQGLWLDCSSLVPCSSLPGGAGVNQFDDGLGNEFVLNEFHKLTNVSGWFRFTFDDFEPNHLSDYVIKLYQGTNSDHSSRQNVPGSILESWTVPVLHSPDFSFLFESKDLYTVDNLDIMLEPGKYWLTAQTLGGGGIEQRVQVGEAYGSVVPEPATMALFGIGMAGAFIRRRKLV